MNPDEKYTEQVLQDSKEDLLKKYKLVKPNEKKPLPRIPHGKLLIFFLLFGLTLIFSDLALPTPSLPYYPTNIFNILAVYMTLLLFAYIPFVLGWEFHKYFIQMQENNKHA